MAVVPAESATGADSIRQGLDALVAAGGAPLDALLNTLVALILAKANGSTGALLAGASDISFEEVVEATGAADRTIGLDGSGTQVERTAAEERTFLEAVRSSAAQGGTGSAAIGNIVEISQTNYDALGAPDSATLYVVTP